MKSMATNKKGQTQSESEVTVKVEEILITVNHGENVKHYRNLKRYSQEYMAAKMGITQPKYSDIERRSDIEDTHLKMIAKILNIGVEWLTDYPAVKGYCSYHQDGNGNTNFQNTGDVNYNINNPVDQIALAYQNTFDSLNRALETFMGDKREAIEAERKEKQLILDKLVSFMDSASSHLSNELK